jgi:hypothetical protein
MKSPVYSKRIVFSIFPFKHQDFFPGKKFQKQQKDQNLMHHRFFL